MYGYEPVSDADSLTNPENLLLALEADDLLDDWNFSNNEDQIMSKPTEKTAETTKKPVEPSYEHRVKAGLDAMFGTVSQYPLRSVLERMMQQCVTEIARAEHLADRIQLGDEALFDMRDQRPQIDAEPNDAPRLTERQYEILVQCQNDETELTAALVQIKAFYVSVFADNKVTYAIRENGRGGWDQVTDFREAKRAEYFKAHRNWLKRQESPRDPQFSAQGAETVIDAAKARANQLEAQL